MGPQEAVDLINAEHHTTYRVEATYTGGQEQGAYLVVDATGARAVMKVSKNPRWADQVKRGKAATDQLRTLGYPVPQYLIIGSADNGSYWVETELPGGPVQGVPTVNQVTDLLRLIDLQKGQVISEVQGQDWVWYITDVVFRGESGNVRTLMQFSPQTSAVVSEAESLVAGLQGVMPPKTDLVHGNMNISQVLYTHDTVSGVVDWDQAGYGDRTIDLVGLWYSLLEMPSARDIVMQHVLQISTKPAILVYAVDKILARVAWEVNASGGDVTHQVNQANQAIALLREL
ncbi:MAG TPA: aminoglycoside phosphotransferase family protein [Candidatus Saccharimonadia bacterium]